jgi:hypothetical protein
MPELPAFEDFYLAHPERFDHSAGRLIDLAIADEAAREGGWVEIPPDPPTIDVDDGWPPETVDLTALQTGFRGQLNRDTCYAFAACAAMEAAYLRQYHVGVDLSEQFAFHLNKVTELVGNYLMVSRPENNSSTWGFQGSSAIIDKLARWAIPDEAACPYLGDAAMQNLLATMPVASPLTEASSQSDVDRFEFDNAHVPLAARYQARFRVRSFAALPENPSSSQIERVVAVGHEVVADIPGHCVLIVGYNRPERLYIIKDSANPGQFQTMSYDGPASVLGGRYVTAVEDPRMPPQRDAMWLGRWQMEHDGWRGELVIRRTSSFYLAANQPTKLGNYNAGGQSFDVNGYFEDDDRIMHFWVAGTTVKVAPGSFTGQEFCAYLMDADPSNAAGWTDYTNHRYGLTLSRTALAPLGEDTFHLHSWVGRWDVSCDGRRGVLVLQSFAPVRGRYEDSRGSFQVEGTHHVHGLTLDIFGLQRFQLFMHTHNTDTASGTTTVGGRTYGVQLLRVGTPVGGEVTAPPEAVPGVVSLSAPEAHTILTGAGYRVSSHWEWTSGEAEGNVSGQEPPAGAPDLPPTTVHIYVRTLPPEPFVPPTDETPIPVFRDEGIVERSPIDR